MKTAITGIKQYDKPILYVSNRTFEQFKSRLQVGQVLSGRVLLAFEDNKYLVRFMGNNVITSSEASFNKGDVVNVLVTNVGDKVEMRLLPHKTANQQNSIIRAISVEEILESLNIPVTQNTIEIANALIRDGIPLTKSAIEELLTHLNSVSGNKNEVVELLALAKALELPINDRVLSNLRLLLSQRLSIGEQLSQLKAEITQLISTNGNLADEQILANLTELIEQIAINPEEVNVVSQIRSFLARLGISHEKTLLLLGKAGNVDNLLENLRANLKSLLLQTRENLLTADGSAPRSAEAERLLALVDGMLQNIEVQQLANQKLSELLPHFYLQIPYTVDGQTVTLEVKGRSEGRDKIDPENIQLDFSIKTVNLGLVRIHLTIVNKHISCDIKVEDERVRTFVNQFTGELTERLQNLNYRMTSIGCHIDTEEIPVMRLVQQTMQSIDKLFHIDLTV